MLVTDETCTIQDAALGAACVHACEHMCVAVIACDPGMRVLAATPRARALLSELVGSDLTGNDLPPAVAEAARAYLKRADNSHYARVAPVCISMPGGARAVYVASTRIEHPPPATAPLAVAVRLQEDGFSDPDLLAALCRDFNLSARDRRLIALLRRGDSNSRMAESLGLTAGTLKVYLHELYEKFDVHSRWQLLALLERLLVGR